MTATKTTDGRSLAQRIARRPALLSRLSLAERASLEREWRFWARPSQLAPPGDWQTWLLLAGRGYGKTRTGSEFVLSEVRAGRASRVALVGPTAADVRDVMVEGPSGLLACALPDERPNYEPSKRRLTWPNGAVATTFSAEEPDRLRGPQHDLAWCDEAACWRYPESWDQMHLGLRLGERPRSVVTTTPRPIPLVRALVSSPTVYVTRGRTRDNRPNLAPSFVEHVERKYGGTRLGRQELDAEILDDHPGALWNRAMLDGCRVAAGVDPPAFERVVVGVDPAVSSSESSDETGIVVVGRAAGGVCWVLADESGRYTPAQWGLRVVRAAHEHAADRVVAEANNGGDLVEANLRAVESRLSIKLVHASKGKRARAEPVAALYEQGKVRHLGSLPALEDQMATWDASSGAPSPDRMDALVWAVTEVALSGSSGFYLVC